MLSFIFYSNYAVNFAVKNERFQGLNCHFGSVFDAGLFDVILTVNRENAGLI